MESHQVIKTFKYETLLAAFATALCYTGAYAYERGFANYFGIPTELIYVTPGSIITAVSSLAVFLISIYIFSSIPLAIARNKKITNLYIYSALSISPLLIFLYIIFYLFDGFKLLTFAFLTIGYLIVCFCLQTMATEDMKNNKSHKNIEAESFTKKIERISGNVILGSFTFFAATSSLGTFVARNTDNFNEFTYNKEKYQIIKSYGDNIISIKPELKTKSRDIYIFKPDDLKGIAITQPKKDSYFK